MPWNSAEGMLNDIHITFNDIVVDKVTFDSATETYSFHLKDGTIVQVLRESIGFAHWDEDPKFYYVFQDIRNVRHIVRMYHNDTMNLMRDVKNVL